MKPFAFLMGLMIILLPLMPCGDSQECSDEQQTISTISHQHEDEEENCTPFCCCACCPASVFTTTDQLQEIGMTTNNISPNNYLSFFYSFDFHAIWQPPKIG